jgi:hypothetical protein
MTIGTRRAALTLIGLVAAIGVSFALGRATAHASSAAPSPSGTSAAYTGGFQAGRAVGVQEGRALQEGQTVTGADHDAATAAFASGYVAGINDAFGGYDGGWSLGTPYLVTLGPGTGGATYRIVSRTGMQPGVSYFVCPSGSGICQEKR